MSLHFDQHIQEEINHLNGKRDYLNKMMSATTHTQTYQYLTEQLGWLSETIHMLHDWGNVPEPNQTISPSFGQTQSSDKGLAGIPQNKY